MISEPVLDWLLHGDAAIRYQVYRDLLGKDRPDLQKRIHLEGWGKLLLSKRNANKHWGAGFYHPKWTCSHYTLLDLKNLSIVPEEILIQDTLELILTSEKGSDGGINPSGTIRNSDVCINGMFLNYATYFRVAEEKLCSIVDFLLKELMPDGGFNCHSNRKGARHSSLHSSLSVLEGIEEYRRNGYIYRLNELMDAKDSSIEFLLMHRLFRSDRTGEVISKRFLTFAYPCRWYYDILRALEFFAYSDTPYDRRIDEALELVRRKQARDGRWKLGVKHAGATHFDMEKAGLPSRWNTLRALKILQQFSEVRG